MSTVDVFASISSGEMTMEQKQVIDRVYENVSSFTPDPLLSLGVQPVRRMNAPQW